jgi:PBSX family phage terminase large subunit
MYSEPFAPKQVEFILNSNAKFNLAHGSVRSGKTVCTLFRFMKAVHDCPGTQIWMIGHTLETIYDNAIQLLFESKQLGMFRTFCTWFPGKKELRFGNKVINCLGAKDERAMGPIQGKTFDLCYCDEFTLYPESVIQMIITRLSMPHSQMFASMNPVQPSHIIKESLIDRADGGDKKYYALHFGVDDNPYLSEDFKQTLRETLTGLFYRRNYLGEWCLAEGAIFDFLDKKIHVVKRPPRAAEFWIAGIDYGASNAFACVLLGFSSGNYAQEGAHMWVEKEYYWDSEKMGRQKRNSEFARDLVAFFDGYSVRACYIDPSAEAFQVELRHIGIRAVHADNDVYNGIMTMTNLLAEGSLTICESCPNLIREMEGYVWDPKKSARGLDEPFKENDHAVDALRYAVRSFLKGKSTMRVPKVDAPGFGRNLGRQRDQIIPQPTGPQRFMI